MRMLGGICLAVLLAGGLFAQVRGGLQTQGTFGNVVFPGGTASLPGVHRNFGNVVFPGTGGPKALIPFSITDPTFASRLGATVAGRNVLGRDGGFGSRRGVYAGAYAYPVYVGGGYPYYDAGAVQAQPAPNITVIYPPQQTPVIINQIAPPDQGIAPQENGNVTVYQAPVRQQAPAGETTLTEPARYLIAYKDHTIYSAIAFWVDGETLHYFTNGNTHNQVSLSLIDRELTERLNKEAGAEIRLPK